MEIIKVCECVFNKKMKNEKYEKDKKGFGWMRDGKRLKRQKQVKNSEITREFETSARFQIHF